MQACILVYNLTRLDLKIWSLHCFTSAKLRYHLVLKLSVRTDTLHNRNNYYNIKMLTGYGCRHFCLSNIISDRKG